MRLLIFVGLLPIVLSSSIPVNDWALYKVKYQKNYSGPEDTRRFQIFQENKKYINDHNAKFFRGEVSFKVDINQYSDMKVEEVNSILHEHIILEKLQPDESIYPFDKLPAAVKEIDWRTKGAVSPVKDQKKCGSCWAFSTTGVVESHNFLKSGAMVLLSEQNLIDCSWSYMNNGCKSGFVKHAYQYIHDKGIDTEDIYPYTARNGTCRFDKENVGTKIESFVSVPKENEDLMAKVLTTVGPVSVMIDASLKSFHHYAGGIYDDSQCNPTKHTHALLIVGYGSQNGQDYWIVKNSWGAHWGEDGYFRISRNKNMCGIANHVTFPIV